MEIVFLFLQEQNCWVLRSLHWVLHPFHVELSEGMRGLGSHWSSCLEYMRVSTQPPGKTLCTWQLLTIPHRGQQVLASSQYCWAGWSTSRLDLPGPLSWPDFLPPVSHKSLPSSSGLGTSVYHLACPLQVFWKCPNYPKDGLPVRPPTAHV